MAIRMRQVNLCLSAKQLCPGLYVPTVRSSPTPSVQDFRRPQRLPLSNSRAAVLPIDHRRELLYCKLGILVRRPKKLGD